MHNTVGYTNILNLNWLTAKVLQISVELDTFQRWVGNIARRVLWNSDRAHFDLYQTILDRIVFIPVFVTRAESLDANMLTTRIKLLIEEKCKHKELDCQIAKVWEVQLKAATIEEDDGTANKQKLIHFSCPAPNCLTFGQNRSAFQN